MRRKRSQAAAPRRRRSQAATRSPGRAVRRYLNAFYDKQDIVLVRRDVDEAVRFERSRAEMSCFIHADDVDQRLLRMIRTHPAVRAAKRDGSFWRIVWRDKTSCEEYSAAFTAKDIQTFEAAISPVRRLAADRRITIARPARVYLDIETDSRVPFSRKEEMRVLTWVLVCGDTGEVIKGVLDEDSNDAERALLVDLWDSLEPFDQVVAWNGDRFDFPVIRARSRRAGADRDPRRWLWLDHMVLFQRMNMMAAESGDEKASFALDSIANAVLGEGKDPFDASRTWEAWEAGGAERERMVRYCVKDTDLMRRLEAKTGYIELLQTLCEATGSFPDTRGANPTSQVETYLLRLALDRDVHFKTRVEDARGQYRGAFVMEPTEKGIVRDVHVADFSSLYPSIILSWNMSPETRVKKPEPTRAGLPANRCPSYLRHYPVVYPEKPDTACEAPTGDWFDTEADGLLPSAVSEMMRLRKEWNDRKAAAPPGTDEWKDADRRSTAYKIAANSFYGVIGSPTSRLFDREVAEAVTQAGVWLIQETIRAAEERGMRVIYGDTDSLFVAGATRAEFEGFVAWCNADLYPRLLDEKGCRANHIKLAYEKAFDRVVFVTAKRYAGLYSHYKGTEATADSKPEVKGLEFKRGDSTRLARKLQEETVNLILAGCEDPTEVETVLKRHRHAVLREPLDVDDIAISKTLSKPIDAYAVRVKQDGTKAKRPPHVEIAAALAERGRDVGEGAKIRYFCQDGSVSPKVYASVEDWDGECDRHELWEVHVFRPTLRVLAAAFPAYDWKPWERSRPPKRRKTKRGQGLLPLGDS